MTRTKMGIKWQLTTSFSELLVFYWANSWWFNLLRWCVFGWFHHQKSCFKVLWLTSPMVSIFFSSSWVCLRRFCVFHVFHSKLSSTGKVYFCFTFFFFLMNHLFYYCFPWWSMADLMVQVSDQIQHQRALRPPLASNAWTESDWASQPSRNFFLGGPLYNMLFFNKNHTKLCSFMDFYLVHVFFSVTEVRMFFWAEQMCHLRTMCLTSASEFAHWRVHRLADRCNELGLKPQICHWTRTGASPEESIKWN